MKTAVIVTLVLALLIPMLLAGCGGKSAEAACACEKGKAGETVWCDACEKGYVDSEATKCAGCFAQKKGGPECVACAAK